MASESRESHAVRMMGLMESFDRSLRCACVEVMQRQVMQVVLQGTGACFDATPGAEYCEAAKLFGSPRYWIMGEAT